MSEQDWVEIARKLPIRHSTRYMHDCSIKHDAIITNRGNGYTMYCFKCGQSDYRSCGTRTLLELSKIRELNEQAATIQPVELPKDTTTEIPKEYKSWLYKASLSNSTIVAVGIGWSPSLHRIVLPLYGPDHNLLYWQARAVSPDQIPKYINPPCDKTRLIYSASYSRDTRRIIVTEDILSCIRVGAHLPTVSIMGTSTSYYQANYLSNYDRVSYWLDPDEAGHRGSKKGIQMLQALTDVEALTSPCDPKNLSDREIRAVLCLSKQHRYTYHGCITFEDHKNKNPV